MSLSLFLRIGPDSHNIAWGEMSDAESVKGDSSEEVMEEMDDEEQKVMSDKEKETMMKKQ